MFNMLITFEENAWEAPPYQFAPDRFLNYTEASTAARLKDLSDPAAVAELCSLPTLFMYEKRLRKTGWLGRVTAVRSLGSSAIELDFEVDRSTPIGWETLAPVYYHLGVSTNGFEMDNTHWAVKKRDLNAILAQVYPNVGGEFISAMPSQRKVTFAPSAFQIPDGKVEPDLVAVMMPFAGFGPTHEAIKDACYLSGHRCVRADDIWDHSTIIQDIFSLIFRANIVVVDFSTKNTNVMYETGIAHTLGKHVVPIAQSLDDVPFDMRHHRVLHYLNNNEGRAKLTKDLAAKLTHLGGGTLIAVDKLFALLSDGLDDGTWRPRSEDDAHVLYQSGACAVRLSKLVKNGAVEWKGGIYSPIREDDVPEPLLTCTVTANASGCRVRGGPYDPQRGEEFATVELAFASLMENTDRLVDNAMSSAMKQ